MTLAQKISGFVELWKLAMPHVPPPSVQDAARWGEYEPEIVEKAILRTARRFAADKITPAFDRRKRTGTSAQFLRERATNDA